MKIGFDAKRFFFNHSGLGNYSRTLIESLLKFHPQHEYVLYIDRLDALKNAHPDAIRILELYGDNGCNGQDRFTLVMVDAPKWWRTWGMGKRVALDGVDVFHGLSNELPMDLPNSVVGVCTIHDVIFKEYPSYYKWWDRLIYHWKTKFAVNRSNRIVMTSERTSLQVGKYYSAAIGKSSVVYQSVHELYSTVTDFPSESASPYWVYQSSFTGRKNHSTLIDAFSKIHKQVDWNLMLVGLEGPSLESLRIRAKALGLDGRIYFKANATQEEMVTIVKQASAFIYPSLSEGFGIPLAEALICDLPMAVSGLAVFKELVEDLPLYFHPNKVEEMSAAMYKITQNDEQVRQRLLRNKLKSKISAEQTSQQMMLVYQQR